MVNILLFNTLLLYIIKLILIKGKKKKIYIDRCFGVYHFVTHILVLQLMHVQYKYFLDY